jgi:hypothetical protein
VLALTVLVGLSAAPPLARAQAEPQPAPLAAADKETARNLYQMGITRFEEKDYAGALEAFHGADAIMHVPTTGLGVGRALIFLGRLVEARDRLLEVRRFPVEPGEPKPYAEARTEAERLTDDLAERIPSLTVELGPVARGTSVTLTVDDIQLTAGTEGLPRSVDPGKNIVVAAKAEGYLDSRQQVKLNEGERRVVRMALTVDPKANKKLPSETTAQPDGASETGGGVSPAVWIGFGVAVVGIAAGAITGALSLGALSDAEALCDGNQCPEAARSDYDSSIALANASNVAFAIGGAGVVVGVVGLLVTDWGGSEDASVQLEPIITPTGAGLRGRF